MITKVQNGNVYVNGKATFLVMNYVTSETLGEVIPGFDAEMSYWNETNPDGGNWLSAKSRYESAKVGYFAGILNSSMDSDKIAANPSIAGDYFFGYSQPDEPDLRSVNVSSLVNEYGRIKTLDPNHIVYLNVYGDIAKYAPAADIVAFDSYPIRETSANRSQFVVHWEQAVSNHVFHFESIESIGKPVIAVLQAVSSTTVGILPPTPAEMRLQAFVALTMNMKGIIFWLRGAAGCSGGGNCGYESSSTLKAAAISILNEIRGLNDLLVRDTLDYSWEGKMGNTSNVSVTPNPTVSIAGGWDGQTFNFIRKQGLLIVINKLGSQQNNITIKSPEFGTVTTNFSPYEIKLWPPQVLIPGT